MKNNLLKWIAIAAATLVFGFYPALGSPAAASLQQEDEDPRQAAVLMLEGRAECTVNGVTKPLEPGMLVPPGAILRTQDKSEMVLFFRQIGTMVRLWPKTAVLLEKMTKYEKEGVLLKETVLNLQQGQLMCVARVLAPESRFEIRTPDHSVVFDGAGMGRLDVDANGTVLVGKRSERPMRVTSLTDAKKSWLVMPGCVFSKKTGEIQPASERALNQLRPKLDQLQNLGKALTPPHREKELSPRDRRKTANK